MVIHGRLGANPPQADRARTFSGGHRGVACLRAGPSRMIAKVSGGAKGAPPADEGF